MQVDATELRPFTTAHLAAAVALSRQAEWPHRREDWALVMELSEGFAAIEGPRLVGTTFMTPFGDFATINMVVVDEAMRGRGLGRRLMQAALDAAGARTCRLVATAEGLPLYRKLGFVDGGRICQHQGKAVPVAAGAGVEWAGASDGDALASLDREATGMDRTALLARLAGLAEIAVVRQAGAVSGYAARRRFGRGEVIGPVVAADRDDARRLISFLLADRADCFMRVDVPEASDLGDWLASVGLAHAGGGIAMQRGGTFPADDRPFQVHALASQALG